MIISTAIAGATLALALSFPAYADFTGKVVAIADGDTLTVLVKRVLINVHLTEIDAPEKEQAYGDRSKQSLSDLCFGKIAKLDNKGKDRYRRTLARVYCEGVDVNAEQIRRGMAWVFERYVTDRSLYQIQDEAKAARRGLWADKEPVRPWEWRRRPMSPLQLPNPVQHVAFVTVQTVTTKDNFFQNLKRPASPNNWLVAPADFVIKPDAIAPVFDVPISGLKQTFKAAILQSKEIATIAESENAMHLVATTRLMRFQDDIRVRFIPVAPDKSTVALYSASRVGYWDTGTNRRRVEDLIKLTESTLASAKK